jgi:hypothetical protein
VAVVIWRTDGEVTEVLAGPRYPGSHVLIRQRERLSAAEKQRLDPEGVTAYRGSLSQSMAVSGI